MGASIVPSEPVESFFPSRKVVEQTHSLFKETRVVFKFLRYLHYSPMVSEDAEVNALSNYAIKALAGGIYILHDKQDIADLSNPELMGLRSYVRNRGREQALELCRKQNHDRRKSKFLPSHSASSIEEMEAPEFCDLEPLFEEVQRRVKSMSARHQLIFEMLLEKCSQKTMMETCKIGYPRLIELQNDLKQAILA